MRILFIGDVTGEQRDSSRIGRLAPDLMHGAIEAPETRNPPMKAGRCPGKAGEYQVLAVRIIPENSIRHKPNFWPRRSFA